jgi:hypothetical protein
MTNRSQSSGRRMVSASIPMLSETFSNEAGHHIEARTSRTAVLGRFRGLRLR